MQHLYPNFYSLVSAPAQPLDPHVRRRSFVWNPSVSRGLNAISYPVVAIDPGTPAIVNSRVARAETNTSGMRKRSASHMTVRQPLAPIQPAWPKTGVSGVSTGTVDANNTADRDSTTSSTASTPPPPPPPGFADEQPGSNRAVHSEQKSTKCQLPPPPPLSVATAPISQSWVQAPAAFYTIPSNRNAYPVYPIQGTGTQSFGNMITTPIDHQPVAAYAAAWTPVVRRHQEPVYQTSIPPAYPTPLNRSAYRASIQSYLIPVRMQTALSLQSLDKLCSNPVTPIPNAPSVKSVHSGHVARPKLVMGLRDLSCSGRGSSQKLKPECSASQQQHPPRSVRQELGVSIPVLATPHSSRPVLIHTRMNSCPSASQTSGTHAMQYAVPIDHGLCRPLRRPADTSRHARMIDRRRTVWDLVPFNGKESIPITYIAGSGQPPVGVAANGVLTIPSASIIQSAGSKTDFVSSGIHSLSSDSGVELAEVELRNKTGASPSLGRDSDGSVCVDTRNSSSAGAGAEGGRNGLKQRPVGSTGALRRRNPVNARRVSYFCVKHTPICWYPYLECLHYSSVLVPSNATQMVPGG
ncbi:unnamed protein product [Echinostoma caproni]|uniref:SP-RING-type domain-containing protein n=1 Tax=Echinostoma caproni TaxID=27848 RepID=A0A183ASZ4_9TREM|nr:unnamed protein product [Echinostoma caproni]